MSKNEKNVSEVETNSFNTLQRVEVEEDEKNIYLSKI